MNPLACPHIHITFTPFLNGFTPYLQIFAGLYSGFALWQNFSMKIGFDKEITVEPKITAIKEKLLKLEIVKKEIEDELATKSKNSNVANGIAQNALQETQNHLNEASIELPKILDSYQEIENITKNRIKVAEFSFLLTAIYCFGLLILSGIETHYQWKIHKIERMIFWYSCATLTGIIITTFNGLSGKDFSVNRKAVIQITMVYLILAVCILVSCRYFDFLEFSSGILNSSLYIILILITPLSPFIVHSWIMPYLIEHKEKSTDMKDSTIHSKLPDSVKQFFNIQQPPI